MSIQELEKRLARAYIVIEQLRSVNDIKPIENQSAQNGYCPNCGKRTDYVESRYRCRYCGQAVRWQEI